MKANNENIDSELRYIVEQETTPCDLWEERRYSIAKEISVPIWDYLSEVSTNEQIAQKAVEYADALINKLKKRDND